MNRRQILAVTAGLLSLATGVFAVRVFWFSPGPLIPDEPGPVEPAKEYSLKDKRLSGPYTHKNLTIYLVHGENTLKGRTPLTLEEAIKRDIVTVHETGEVNELAVENTSAKEEVFIQAGDIVKGGQQDRVLAVDLIIPAKSGRIPIDSFCVEQGRWTARGTERRDRFESASDYAPSKEIKLAAKTAKSQSQVWREVAASQEKLNAATNTNTASNVSRSSLPLTLENEQVRENSGDYIKALSGIVDDKNDVIGFVFLINGQINSSDIYGSSEVFIKLWPKLLKAASIEAVSEFYPRDPRQKDEGVPEIEAFLTNAAETAPVTDLRQVTDRIHMTTRESDTTAFIQTLDRGTMLHLNYIYK